MTEEQKRKPRPPDDQTGGKTHGGPSRRKGSGRRFSKKSLRRKKGKGKSMKDLALGCIEPVRAGLMERFRGAELKRTLISNIPYLITFYLVEKEAWLYRHCTGDSVIQKLMNLFLYFSLAFQNPLPSLHLWDLAVGAAGAAGFKAFIGYRMKNAKKFRQGEEYGSARWGTHKDIAPFIDPVFENNIILTATEFLTMNSRPKNWKVARNKNVIVIGGSGSGKTRNVIKPNLMQMGPKISYVLTDPNVSVS